MRYKDQEKIDRIVKIIEYWRLKEGIEPTISQIAADANMSRSCVHNYLTEMNEKGLIDMTGEKTMLHMSRAEELPISTSAANLKTLLLQPVGRTQTEKCFLKNTQERRYTRSAAYRPTLP